MIRLVGGKPPLAFSPRSQPFRNAAARSPNAELRFRVTQHPPIYVLSNNTLGLVGSGFLNFAVDKIPAVISLLELVNYGCPCGVVNIVVVVVVIFLNLNFY